MSEYWKSTPKYWCKHCSTYVKDTPLERKQHESTGKHQGALKRFLRDIQNNHERGERDKERAKTEVERLKGSFVHNASVGAEPKSTLAPTARSSTTKTLSADDRKRQWSQLADMGIQVPQDFRNQMAMAGDWSTISSTIIEDQPQEESLSIGIKKRRHIGQEEEEEVGEEAGESIVRRGWGAATKTFPGQNEEDLDHLLSHTIAVGRRSSKPNTNDADLKNETQSASLKQEIESASAGGTSVPGGNCQRKRDIDGGDPSLNEVGSSVKKEEDGTTKSSTIKQDSPDIQVPVFKKRRAKAS